MSRYTYGKNFDFSELDAVEKDILLFYHWNVGEDLVSPEVSRDTFDKNYWEYLTLVGDDWSHKGVKDFFLEGCLVLIIAMSYEYLEYTGSYGTVFLDVGVAIIRAYVHGFKPKTYRQERPREIAELGLRIIIEAKPDEDGMEFEHPRLDHFRFREGPWVQEECIKGYYWRTIKKA